MKLLLAPCLALICGAAAADATAVIRNVTRHVNPFFGTDGTGHVFPDALRPFGMGAPSPSPSPSPSPDTADSGWSYSGGYQLRDQRILGLSNTHNSGAGIPRPGERAPRCMLTFNLRGQPVLKARVALSTVDVADAPHKGHALVRRIAGDFHTDPAIGIVGNDDCGQMSAWYVFATPDRYPVQPASTLTLRAAS